MLWTVARIVAAMLASYAGMAIIALPLALLAPRDLAGGPLGLAGLGLAEAGGIAGVLLVWRWIDREPIASLGLEIDGSLGRWLRGAATGAALMLSVVAIAYLVLDPAVWLANPDASRATLALVIGFLAYLIQGPAEEILFRGYIFENIALRAGDGWATAVSSALFGLAHAANAHFSLLALCNLLLFAVAMCLFKTRLDDGQLWGVGAIHTVWNWLQQVVFGLPNSGSELSPANTLLHAEPDPRLPDAIWGGGFGPEGTIVASLLLCGLIVAILRFSVRTTGQQHPVVTRS